VIDLLTEQWPWRERAACRDADLEVFFPENSGSARARKICAGCPVRAQCLDHAVTYDEPFGIWGGLNRLERKAA
jgi:WhiB family redox-sensing transcriptional regulator